MGALPGTGEQQVTDEHQCEGCHIVPATTYYDGDHLCRDCAREYFKRDLEEGDLPPGYGED